MKPRCAFILVCLLALFDSALQSEPPANDRTTRTDLYGDPLPPGTLARLGSLRLRHPGGAWAVAYSPDGKIVASGGRDCMVRLWDTATGKELHRLQGHETWVQALAFTADGKILASSTAANDRRVILWDVARGKELRRFPGHPNGTRLTFSPDGKRLVTAGGDRVIRVRETATGKELWNVTTQDVNGIGSVAYSPDGRLLLSTGSLNPGLRMWDAATGKELRPFLNETRDITETAFAPDGKGLASVHLDETVRMWEVASGKEVWRGKVDGRVWSLAFAPDGKTLALGIEKGLVRVWDATKGKELRQIQGSKNVHPVAFSPNSKSLAGAGETIRFWDVQTGKDLFPPRGLRGQINVLGFAADGKTLTSVSADDTVRVWDAATGKEIRRTGGMKVLFSEPTFTPDGRLLLLERRVGEVRLWDATAGTEPLRFKVIPPADPFHSPGGGGVHAAALSADGKRLAAHDADGTVRIWDVKSGKELCHIKVKAIFHPGVSIVFAPDGKTVLLPDGGLYDAASGKELRRFKGFSSGSVFAFARDGKTLVSGGIGGLDLIEVASGKRLRSLSLPDRSSYYGHAAFGPGGRTFASRMGSFPGGGALWDVRTGKVLGHLTGSENDVVSFAFSPDGRTLALGLWDHSIRLWDAFTGQEIRRFLGHQSPISALAFSAEGRKLASGSWDCTGLVWDATGGITVKSVDARRLQDLWSDLAATDAAVADRAFWTLAAVPDQTITLLRERLLTSKPAAKTQTNRLIADLDSDEFVIRDKAQHELERMGDRAESALRVALEKKPSLEARRRIENLLARLKDSSPELDNLPIRQLRAVRILEQIGTAPAREFLDELAIGAKESALATEARSALARCTRRQERRDLR